MTRLRAALTTLLLGLLLGGPAVANDKVYYYSSDTLQSEVIITDASRNVVERTYYAPYGQVLNRGLRDGPGYTGHEEDPESGLAYMQQRYFDPESGRFLSSDPVATTNDGAGFNRYVYANDNPYRYTDPMGAEGVGFWNDSENFATADHDAGLSLANMRENLPIIGGIALAGAAFATGSLAEAGEAGSIVSRIGQVARAIQRTVAAGRLAKNVAQGKAGEAITRAKLGDRVAGEQVTFKTSTGARTRVDFVTKDGGVVETKTGNSPLSRGQTQLQSDIGAGRSVTPVGENAANAGLKPGEPIKMSCFDVDRPC